MAFNTTLGIEFGFTKEELEANRAGQLGPDQELILRNAASFVRHRTKRVTVMLAIVFAATIALVAYGISSTPGGGTTEVIVPVVILAWIGAITLWGMRRNRRHQAELDRPELVTVEGEADFEPMAFDSSIGNMYHLLIGGRRLAVTGSQMDAMEAGARYRVHYLDTRVGLPVPSSLERVDDDQK